MKDVRSGSASHASAVLDVIKLPIRSTVRKSPKRIATELHIQSLSTLVSPDSICSEGSNQSRKKNRALSKSGSAS